MAQRIGCVLQPTFLPWLGWFDIVDQCDVVVILDDVGFSKQSWQQRNRIRGPEGLEFLSVPVKTAGRLGQPIHSVELADARFEAKALGRVRAAYQSAPYFGSRFPGFSAALASGTATGSLIELNMGLIDLACRDLGMSCVTIRSGDLDTGGARGDKVARLCGVLDVDVYLSPAGAARYLIEDASSFDERGIQVRLHQYEHPVYLQQFDPFLSHASIIDLLFNEGPRSMEILRSGRRDTVALPREGV